MSDEIKEAIKKVKESGEIKEVEPEKVIKEDEHEPPKRLVKEQEVNPADQRPAEVVDDISNKVNTEDELGDFVEQPEQPDQIKTDQTPENPPDFNPAQDEKPPGEQEDQAPEYHQDQGQEEQPEPDPSGNISQPDQSAGQESVDESDNAVKNPTDFDEIREKNLEQLGQLEPKPGGFEIPERKEKKRILMGK